MTTHTTTPQEWEKLKNRGNVSFANKQYREAAELYRDAIKLRPGEASLYSNRCLCTCKLYAILSARNEIEADERERMLVEAQKDAERVVGLKPAWWKGWFRRGVVASLRRQHLKSWKYLFRAQKVNDDPKYVKMLNQELRKARRLVPKRFELNEDGSTVETIELSSTPSRPNALKGNPVYEAFAGRDYQGIHPLTHFERIGGPRVARCENACFFLGVQWAQAFCHARRDVFYETPGTQEAMGRAMQRRGIDLRSQRAIETMNRLSGMIDPNNNMCMFATSVFQTQSNFVSCLCAASSNSMFQALALGENPSLGIPNVPLNDLVNWNTFFNGRTPPELVFGKTRRGATRSERGATDVLNQLQWIKINMQNCAMRAAPTMRNPSTGQYVASTLLHGSAPNVCQLGDLHTPSESNSPEAKRATELIEASMQSMTPQEAIKTLRRALNEGCEWQIDGMNLPLYRSLQRSVSWAFRSALIHAWSYAIRKRFAEALASAKWAAKFIELADLTLSPEFSVIRYYPGSPCVVLKRNDHGTRPHCHTRGAVFCHSMYRAPLLFVLHINTMMRKMCKTKKGNELYSTDVDIDCCLRLYENIEANREVEQRGLTASQKILWCDFPLAEALAHVAIMSLHTAMQGHALRRPPSPHILLPFAKKFKWLGLTEGSCSADNFACASYFYYMAAEACPLGSPDKATYYWGAANAMAQSGPRSFLEDVRVEDRSTTPLRFDFKHDMRTFRGIVRKALRAVDAREEKIYGAPTVRDDATFKALVLICKEWWTSLSDDAPVPQCVQMDGYRRVTWNGHVRDMSGALAMDMVKVRAGKTKQDTTLAESHHERDDVERERTHCPRLASLALGALHASGRATAFDDPHAAAAYLRGLGKGK
eukprot:g3032.t1